MKAKIKKTLYLFSLILLALTSCSKDDNASEQASPVLVKKIIRTYVSNGSVNTETQTYKYDGNKIVSSNNNGAFVTYYIYTGDVITKIEERIIGSTYLKSTDYTYSNGKVATKITKENSGATISDTYTYNSNGTVSYSHLFINNGNTSTATGMFTFINGNIVKSEYNSLNSSQTNTYEFDTKNNPFKNVLGFNLLFYDNEDTFSPNNMTKDVVANYIFKYDVNGYPTEKQFSNSSSSETTQFFY